LGGWLNIFRASYMVPWQMRQEFGALYDIDIAWDKDSDPDTP
jgi:hypothetical protein